MNFDISYNLFIEPSFYTTKKWGQKRKYLKNEKSL